jgi:hypothetical protein
MPSAIIFHYAFAAAAAAISCRRHMPTAPRHYYAFSVIAAMRVDISLILYADDYLFSPYTLIDVYADFLSLRLSPLFDYFHCHTLRHYAATAFRRRFRFRRCFLMMLRLPFADCRRFAALLFAD